MPNLPTAPHDPYDDVPYTNHAFAESHPDRLAVVARMSGWEPPAIEGARILELGCGVGGNLLAMAEQLPRATLVGVDRSKRQIEIARGVADSARLTNVTFHEASFDDVELAPASFDFVIAHGVYSWIAIDARRALLRVIARALAPNGVAYVSFNTLPGWYERMAARDWLRFARDTPGLGPTGRDALTWLKERASPEQDAYKRQLDRVSARLGETELAYLMHEYLSPEHRPELATTVLGEASDAGLAYVNDGIPTATAVELLDDETQARASGLDAIATQQLVDFVKCTAFRRGLFVRADTCKVRGWRWSSRLDPRAIDRLRIASRLRVTTDATNDAEQVEGPDGIVHVFDPIARVALRELAKVAPRSLAFDELCSRTKTAIGHPSDVDDVVRAELFDIWLAIGGLDLHAFEPHIASAASSRPRASAVARHDARTGGVITNLWHQEVRIAEELVRFVLARLDGTRSCDAVAREVREALGSGALVLEGANAGAARALSAKDVETLVRASVDLLAKSALLVE